MLILVTGSPGAGKTSNTLWEFLHNPDFAGRPKFASDIPDFDRAVHGIGDFTDIEKWQDYPDGSLIFCDEAQRFLRPRSGRAVPDWLGAFETHRHRGFDFVFVTQHPSLIDSHVRRLIGRHHHYHRPFGIRNPIRYTWEYCQESPGLHAFKDAVRKTIRTNPEVFKLYRSTAVDTHKRQLPLGKFAVAGVGVAMIIGGLVYPFLHLNNKDKAKQAPATVSSSPGSAQTTDQPGQHQPIVAIGQPVEVAKPLSASDFQPRIKNVPWSAPYYDQLTAPTDFPRIAACMDSKSKGCSCYSQQATPVDVEPAVCRDIVAKGTFDNWKTQREQQQLAAQQAAQAQTEAGLDVPTTEVRKPGAGQPAVGEQQAVQVPVKRLDLSAASYTQSPAYSGDLLTQSGYRAN